MSLDLELMSIEERLAGELLALTYPDPPVAFVYNPIDHASQLHSDFLGKFYSGGVEPSIHVPRDEPRALGHGTNRCAIRRGWDGEKFSSSFRPDKITNQRASKEKN